jgi:hypothetical protein
MLQRGDERELHGLTLLIASVGRGKPAPDSDLLVGIRLEPNRLDDGLRRRIVAPDRTSAVDRQSSFGPSSEHVQTHIGGDLVEPWPDQPISPEPRKRPPRPHEGLLESVLGVVQGAQHSVAVGVQLGAEHADEAMKRLFVTAACGVE